MNKTTFSHYGTIIAVVIILAIMVAFATPFGDYVSNSAGQTIDSFSTKSNTQLSEANGRNFRFAKLKGLNQTLIVSAANQSSQPLQFDAVEVVDPTLANGLVAFTSGTVDELNAQNAVIYDIDVSGEYSSATLDLNVSEFANTGETVAVYHYNEGASEWEHIGNYTVSASGIITASFTSFSPVAIVNISRDYTTTDEPGNIPEQESATQIITFSIESTTCHAAYGMTWKEYWESDYRTDAYDVYVVTSSGPVIIGAHNRLQYNEGSSTEDCEYYNYEIQEGHTYHIKHVQAGGGDN